MLAYHGDTGTAIAKSCLLHPVLDHVFYCEQKNRASLSPQVTTSHLISFPFYSLSHTAYSSAPPSQYDKQEFDHIDV